MLMKFEEITCSDVKKGKYMSGSSHLLCMDLSAYGMNCLPNKAAMK